MSEGNRKRSSSTPQDGMQNQVRKEVDETATAVLKRIFGSYDQSKAETALSVLQKFFRQAYNKIVVNDNQINNLKQLFASRKGPIVFIPTHRSYVDFLVVSTILFAYGMEAPMICAGEDFLNLGFVADILRGSGAFFMRRTFRGDDLYKSIFYEYVRVLAKDR